MSTKHRMWLAAVTITATAFVAGCGDDSTGLEGPPGPACWDLNENGGCDPADEDMNADGLCTVADCSSLPGFSCWDLNENHECDPTTEDTNGDTECTVADCRPSALHCWDLDENGACDVATEDINDDDVCTVADCNGLPGVACWDLDGNGSCDAATEDINDDGDCDALDCGSTGAACWDLNTNGTCDALTEDVDGDGTCTMADCAGQDTGIVVGSVVDQAGAPVADATVTFFPALLTVTTDATGAFTADEVVIGVYILTASKTDYDSGTATDVAVATGATTTVDPITITAHNPLSVEAGSNLYQVGYGATVDLAVRTTLASASGAATLTYSWAKTSGPAVLITGGDTLSPTVTMPTLDEAFTAAGDGYGLRDRTEILPIAPRYQGKVTLTLTVTGGGFTKTDTMTISAAEPTGSVLDVGVGINVFFQAAEGTGTYSWTLTPPSGSSAALDSTTIRTPRFIPDVAGSYTLALSGGPSFAITAGNWLGVEGATSTCTGCHSGGFAPNTFTPYDATKHASMMERNIDDATGHYSSSCLACHSVGNSAAADNGGFDDVARGVWTFPATLAPGNWAAIPAAVQKLGNIQCENCHGPQLATHAGASAGRQSMNSGMCAQCHDSGTHHYRPAEWVTTPHSDLQFARDEGVSSGSCARCHGSQGYLAYSDRLDAGTAAAFTSTELAALGITDANVEPITCQTCHDPHDATNPNQLRQYDSVAMLPAGFGVAGVGKGALCMTCHNTRNGIATGGVAWLHDDTAPASRLTSYSGPHAPSQADVLMGQNAFFVGRGGYGVSRHAAIGDTCVSCHMSESEFGEGYGDHTWTVGEETCVSCHGEGVTGDATQETVRMRLEELEDLIANKTIGIISGLVGASTPAVVRAWDETTDCYSSTCTGSGCVSPSNVLLDQVPTAATLEHIHGQSGFCFTVPTAVTWTKAGTGCSGDITSTSVCFQLGSLKAGPAPGGTTVVPSTDVLVKAMWNESLINTDGSFGIHNPTWVLNVLRATYDAVFARP